MNDDLGDRIKLYESLACPSHFLPNFPVLVRIDGRAFHSFTRGLDKPFDTNLTTLMDSTAAWCVRKTGAKIGYVQSDEITLLLYSDNYESQIFFNGKVQKIISVCASIATAFFNKHIADFLPEKTNSLVEFDARAFQVPNLIEATNVFLWRELDAVRNSIQMAARSVYSHRECENKNCADLQDMLHTKGINWNDYPRRFKRGSYFNKNGLTDYSEEFIKLSQLSVEDRVSFILGEFTDVQYEYNQSPII